MSLLNAADITALSSMLKPDDEDSDSDEDLPCSSIAKMGPSQIGPPKKNEQQETTASVKTNNEKEIWAEEEVHDGAQYEDVYDPRPQPEYDIIYKQAVTSEDMFLQMGNKTPASASCEAMVVKVKLPDTKFADVKLDVTDKFLDCRTPKYKLGLHLPHPVDSKNGKAKWETENSVLVVNLTMRREYDFVNF